MYKGGTVCFSGLSLVRIIDKKIGIRKTTMANTIVVTKASDASGDNGKGIDNNEETLSR
jgi:hypothetical protein